MKTRNVPHTEASLLALTNKVGDCLVWQGTKRSNGYGVTVYLGKQTTTHRVMYALHFGGITEVMEVDHTCNRRDCINPEHLQAVTHQENMRLGALRRKSCKAGHEWNERNTYVKEVKRKQGGTRMQRYCRVCRAKHQADLRARRDLTGLNNKGGIVK